MLQIGSLVRLTKKPFLQNLLMMAYSNGVSSTKKQKFDAEINRVVWVDMEMTGLNIDKDHILEIACIITDSDLNVISEGPHLIINQPKSLLDGMDEWCKKHHGKTGLTTASLESKISVMEAEDRVLKFVQEHITEKMSPLAGNSVYMDRLFLRKYMPRLDNYLHYRIIDVSTVKELCRRWAPDLYKNAPKKVFNHRALDDIKESISEMKYYKENFFKLS